MRNGFHSHHNAEHPADPIKLVAELAKFVPGLRAAQRICKIALTLIFLSKQNGTNEDKKRGSLRQ